MAKVLFLGGNNAESSFLFVSEVVTVEVVERLTAILNTLGSNPTGSWIFLYSFLKLKHLAVLWGEWSVS